jgi:hypothetical protein
MLTVRSSVNGLLRLEEAAKSLGGHAVAFELTEHRTRQALVKFWRARNSSGVHLSTS